MDREDVFSELREAIQGKEFALGRGDASLRR
jgi:hypothetical protein